MASHLGFSGSLGAVVGRGGGRVGSLPVDQLLLQLQHGDGLRVQRQPGPADGAGADLWRVCHVQVGQRPLQHLGAPAQQHRNSYLCFGERRKV